MRLPLPNASLAHAPGFTQTFTATLRNFYDTFTTSFRSSVILPSGKVGAACRVSPRHPPHPRRAVGCGKEGISRDMACAWRRPTGCGGYHDIRSHPAWRARSISMAATIDATPALWPRTGPEVDGRPPPTLVLWSPSPREERALPSQGQATGWEPPGGLDRPCVSARWRQQLRHWCGTCREAHRRGTRAACNCCWEPRRETCRPQCAEATLDMATTQAGLAVAAMLCGL